MIASSKRSPPMRTLAGSAGATTRYIIPFEALLVRQDSRWLIVMERQFAAADEAAWNAMAR